MLQLNVSNLRSGISGGICLHILDAQVDSLLQRLDPPKRPVRYHGGTANRMIHFQLLYFSKEKVDLIYIATAGVPTRFLHRGPGVLRGREEDIFLT